MMIQKIRETKQQVNELQKRGYVVTRKRFFTKTAVFRLEQAGKCDIALVKEDFPILGMLFVH